MKFLSKINLLIYSSTHMRKIILSDRSFNYIVVLNNIVSSGFLISARVCQGPLLSAFYPRPLIHHTHVFADDINLSQSFSFGTCRADVKALVKVNRYTTNYILMVIPRMLLKQLVSKYKNVFFSTILIKNYEILQIDQLFIVSL